MARPQKKGLDYFPLDTTMDKTNDDIEMLEAKYVTNGFKTIIKLYMKIYQEEGYFLKWCEKSSLLLAKRVNADINEINSIINDLVHWGVFDEIMFNEYQILTSRRIQSTYMDVTKKRKQVIMIDEFLLVEAINDNINLINVGINPQSKEKETKVKKKKEQLKKIGDEDSQIAFIVSLINDNVKILKPLEYQILDEWIDLYDYKIIEKAIKISIMNNAKSFRYIEKILLNWEELKLNTIEKVDEYLSSYSKQKGSYKQKNLLPKDIKSDWLDDYIKNL